MFEAKQFLKLTINEKANQSNSSQKSVSSLTLNTYTPTITCTQTPTITNFDDIVTPTYMDTINHLSLSSLPSLANQPNLGYNTHSNVSNVSNVSNTKSHSSYPSSNMSSSSQTMQLNFSETALTPNMAAVANNNQNKIPTNTFIIGNDDNFSLDTINTINTINTHNEIKHNINQQTEECKDTIRIHTMDIMNEHDQDIKDVDHELLFLKKRGYTRGKQIAVTLQGFIYEIRDIKTGISYVVKMTDKQLHSKGITIQNGKKYAVKEDIINENAILQLLSKQTPPAFMIKYIDFFESQKYYYLLMEHGGTDLFEFIIEAHKHIQSGKLSIKEWRKFIKYIFWQMSVLLLWLHNSCHACHLDVSLENLLVKNAKFIPKSNGQLSISTNIQIKFCDFGLAEFYCIDNELDHDNIPPNIYGFQSTKYCGKTNYKSPQVYNKKGSFDGRKNDVWSLGVVLFCMAVGAPPYKKPNTDDRCFHDFIKKGHIAQLLYQWKRHHYVTEHMLSLIKSMLKYDENARFAMDDIVKHPWLRTYYKRYYPLIKRDLLQAK